MKIVAEEYGVADGIIVAICHPSVLDCHTDEAWVDEALV